MKVFFYKGALRRLYGHCIKHLICPKNFTMFVCLAINFYLVKKIFLYFTIFILVFSYIFKGALLFKEIKTVLKWSLPSNPLKMKQLLILLHSIADFFSSYFCRERVASKCAIVFCSYHQYLMIDLQEKL